MGKYIDFYKKHIKAGSIENGLCNYFDNYIDDVVFELMTPTHEDRRALEDENLCTTYWASGMHEDLPYPMIHYPFTPLRQTIVLFMAALAGEFDED